jgi:hypothetical protein
MGFSGVQLCGLKTAYELETVMKTARQMMGEFRTFREWSDEWKSFHHGVEMATPPHSFYMFKNLMNFKTKCELDDNFKLSEADFDTVSFSREIKYHLASLFSLEKRTGKGSTILRKVLTGESAEGSVDLRKTQYVPISTCPKKMIYGPCGGSQIDGACENGLEPCIHNVRTSMAAFHNELDVLEDPHA